jgi:predicted MFS family arabinose efflux permease
LRSGASGYNGRVCGSTRGKHARLGETIMADQRATGHGQHERAGKSSASAWSPFGHPAFAVLWTATVVANIGTWMYNAGSGWLMTGLNADPFVVSLVQVATTLPMFLFALPAGALADIVDKRRLLIAIEVATTVLSAIIAALVWLDIVTPASLLVFTFLLGAGAALTAPAWQSVVPQLVPTQDLAPAVAANSVGVNISRAVGPALAGVIIAGFGIASPFWVNAVSNLGIIGALLWWRSPHRPIDQLPAERLFGAMRTGFRYAWHNAHLRATLARAVAFFLFGSAYWAFLPLVARNQISGGPQLYGVLLGAIGAAAVGGAFALPSFKAALGPDRLVAVGTIGTAITLVLFGLAHEPIMGLAASLIAGVSWIAVLASLNVSAQVALPDWVRGRGLAMFGTVFFGAMTVGSAAWGEVAAVVGLPAAHFIAAAGALAAIPLTWRWKLQTGAGIDFTPSLHWPAPVITREVEPDRGPVLVTVEYRIEPADRKAFVAALERLCHERRRDGAYAWGLFEDTAEQGRFLETFFVESWLEHLRQHHRVTNADRIVQAAIERYHLEGRPKVTHFIAVDPADRSE